jgi:hypothetical protein
MVIAQIAWGRKFTLKWVVLALHWFVSGSDPPANLWRENAVIADFVGIDLHWVMPRLAEELPAKEKDGRTPPP